MFQYIAICIRSIPRKGSTADAVLSGFDKAGEHAIVGPDLLMRHALNFGRVNQARLDHAYLYLSFSSQGGPAKGAMIG